MSFGEKAAEDSAGGTKSTKRRKKKNQTVDEGGPAATTQVRVWPSGGNAREDEDEDDRDAEYKHHSVLFFICVFILIQAGSTPTKAQEAPVSTNKQSAKRPDSESKFSTTQFLTVRVEMVFRNFKGKLNSKTILYRS